MFKRLCPYVPLGHSAPWGFSCFGAKDWSVRGLRVFLALLPFWREGYEVNEDRNLTGWWLGSLKLAAEYDRFKGVSLRLSWGWVRPAVPFSVGARAY